MTIQADLKMGNMFSTGELTCDTHKPEGDEKKGAQCREKHMPKNFVFFDANYRNIPK